MCCRRRGPSVTPPSIAIEALMLGGPERVRVCVSQQQQQPAHSPCTNVFLVFLWRRMATADGLVVRSMGLFRALLWITMREGTQNASGSMRGLSQPGGAPWRVWLVVLLSFNMMASVECQWPPSLLPSPPSPPPPSPSPPPPSPSPFVYISTVGSWAAGRAACQSRGGENGGRGGDGGGDARHTAP